MELSLSKNTKKTGLSEERIVAQKEYCANILLIGVPDKFDGSNENFHLFFSKVFNGNA